MTTRKPSAEERELFRAAMQGAKPLARKKRASTSIVAPAKAGAHASANQGGGPMDPRLREDDKEKDRPAAPPAPPAPRPLAAGRIADLDKRTAERFKRGEMAIEAKIDLHGMTQGQAHDRLQDFVAKAAAAGQRCVLVVTGKGAGGWGVLRESVPRWLNEPALRRHLLAFSSAKPRHGGAGALYLLLKRRRAAP
jgi:DNA-nicking Smr family endonuclease